MEFSAKINTQELEKAFKKFPDVTIKNVVLGLKKHSRDVQEEARKTHRFKSKSGLTEISIEDRVDARMLKSEIGLNTSVSPWGNFLHEGTKARPIFAKNKKALRFLIKGRFVFAKYAKEYPGIKRDPFIVDAAKRLRSNFNVLIGKAIKKSAEGVF